jgi:hypothetical protein
MAPVTGKKQQYNADAMQLGFETLHKQRQYRKIMLTVHNVCKQITPGEQILHSKLLCAYYCFVPLTKKICYSQQRLQ